MTRERFNLGVLAGVLTLSAGTNLANSSDDWLAMALGIVLTILSVDLAIYVKRWPQ